MTSDAAPFAAATPARTKPGSELPADASNRPRPSGRRGAGLARAPIAVLIAPSQRPGRRLQRAHDAGRHQRAGVRNRLLRHAAAPAGAGTVGAGTAARLAALGPRGRRFAVASLAYAHPSR